MSPAIEKQQFENQSGGWVGAVVIGVKGEETGVAVEPGGTVWLSEAEQILTANAPRKPEDNPFIERVTKGIDPQSGELAESRVTPLVPIERDRYIPANDRPIPGELRTAAQRSGDAQVAATADEPTSPVAVDPVAEREAAVKAAGERAKPNVPLTPPKAAAAAQAAHEAHQKPHETEPPPVPEPGASTEATAAEATGAAEAPTGDPPQGEYQAGEEVGTPDASEQTAVESKPGATAGEPDTDTSTGARPPAPMPAPYTPQDRTG